jgi:hypothetical protein
MTENADEPGMNDPRLVKPLPAIARQLGTANQLDRSRQYTQADAGELLRSLNAAWSKIRLLEQGRAKDAVIIAKLHADLRRKWVGYLMAALVSAGVALAWEVGMLFAPIALRWLGAN